MINPTILWDLKTRMEKEKRFWTNELPNVLWAYHATLRKSTRKFVMETIVPVKS